MSLIPAETPSQHPKPNTEFDWAIYADATFAGLAVLIPIPILDWIFEQIFRRRMLNTIAYRRKRKLDPGVITLFKQLQSRGWLRGCLALPLVVSFWLLKRISRKILYFLTVKEAADTVSYYWHRAFLLDYMLKSGHLNQIDEAERAYVALHEVLDDITVSPLSQLAQEITRGTKHVFRLLRLARKDDGSDTIAEKQAEMRAAWANFSSYFEALAGRFDTVYEAIGIEEDV